MPQAANLPRTAVSDAAWHYLEGAYGIKADLAEVCLVPEEESTPFHTLDAVLLREGTFQSTVKYAYDSTADFVRVPLFSKLLFEDKREAVVLFAPRSLLNTQNSLNSGAAPLFRPE